MHKSVGRRWFFSYWWYLKEKDAGKQNDSDEKLFPNEDLALRSLQTEDLIWRLSVRDDMPFNGITDVLKTPSNVLFQAAILADINDRMIRKEKLRAAADKAMQEAQRGRR